MLEEANHELMVKENPRRALEIARQILAYNPNSAEAQAAQDLIRQLTRPDDSQYKTSDVAREGRSPNGIQVLLESGVPWQWVVGGTEIFCGIGVIVRGMSLLILDHSLTLIFGLALVVAGIGVLTMKRYPFLLHLPLLSIPFL